MPVVHDEQIDAVASLTGALVDANDRLLGLLALITTEPPTSLSTTDLLNSIADQASSILQLDCVEVSGSAKFAWGTKPNAAEGHWQTSVSAGDLGVVDITFERAQNRFSTGDTKLLAAVARLVANAIVTADVHERTLTQAVVAREHATAAQVATAALPDIATTPTLGGLSFFANLVPARETGGDLFTWQEAGDDVWFAIGDVSGKGLPAAVLMSTGVSAIDAAILRHHDAAPAVVLAAVERWLHQRLEGAAMFMTLAIGKWNRTSRRLVIVNAGHSPVIWCEDGETSRVEASAPPLGVIAGCEVTPWETTTEPGTVLVLATDGFTEQQSLEGALFGEDTFDDAAGEAAQSSTATAIGNKLIARVADHGQGCAQSDDRALLVLRFP